MPTDDAKDGTSKDQQADSKDDQKDDAAGLKSALEKEREARQRFERDYKATKTELDKLSSSGKSESDKLTARLESLERERDELAKKHREAATRDAARDAAKKAGATDPDLVYRFVKSDVTYGDDGEPTNVDELVKDAKVVAPQLFRPVTGKGDGGAGNDTQPTKANDWIRAGFATRRGG